MDSFKNPRGNLFSQAGYLPLWLAGESPQEEGGTKKEMLQKQEPQSPIFAESGQDLRRGQLTFLHSWGKEG